jgi:hypothetical protein
VKKVIFFMIDSFMPDVLEKCLKEGKVPALAFFMKKGMYWNECTTVFPTMTASVDCSLITGEYPDKHKIPALIWYSPEEKRIINYINGGLPLLPMGITNCAKNVLCALNDEHLSKEVKTIFETLEDQGRTSGSINLIAHRSYHKYKLKLPFLLRLATRFTPFNDVTGPEIFTMGSLVRSKLNPPLPWSWDESLFRYYGLNDAFAVRFLTHLIRYQILPDFTMVYLPENDHQVHLHPERACEILAKVDTHLQKFLNQFSSWDEAVEQYLFILTGDHGQTTIGKSENHNIDLEGLLTGMQIATYGDKTIGKNDLVIANNERMTYIYPMKPHADDEVIARCKKEPRIDLIAWKESDWVHVCSGKLPGMCRFRRGGEIRDIYGADWAVEGDLQLLDLSLESEGQTVRFGEFPDVFSRLYGALYSQDIPFVVLTAAPGYEFKSAYAPTHLGGGSHGSIHIKDSTIPLIISGGNDHLPAFKEPRLVDLKGYILQVLCN